MGLFVTIEGIDGCGKSTQAGLLAEFFRSKGHAVVHTFQPGGTGLGRSIREWVLQGRMGAIAPVTESLLMASDRSHHVHTVIQPALAVGSVVICERYADSMEAYQGYGTKVPLDIIRTLNDLATGGLAPDLTVLLDIDPEAALLRRGKDPDRIEGRGRDFYHDVRQGYLNLSAEHKDRYVVLDAAETVESVHRHIVDCLQIRGLLARVSDRRGVEA